MNDNDQRHQRMTSKPSSMIYVTCLGYVAVDIEAQAKRE